MATNFRKPSKKTAIIAIISVVVLLAIAITGTVVFLKDRGTTEAHDIVAQQENKKENVSGKVAENNQGTSAEPNTENAGTDGNAPQSSDGTTENVGTAGNVQNNGNTVNNGNAGTTVARQGNAGTTANNGNPATSNIQESTIIESNTIYTENPWETHNVSWKPISVNAEFVLAKVDDKDVEVKKEADKTVKQGEIVTYKISVENPTDKDLNSIEVKDILNDDILDITSIEYLTKQEVNREDNIVVWTVDVKAKETVEIIFTAKVKTDVTAGTTLKNSVVANGVKLENPTETTIEEATKDIEVEKEWKNIENDAAKAHKITGIKVKATGNETEKEVTLNKDNNWKGTIASLPKYDAQGKEIVYTISEEGLTDTDKANLAKYYKDPVINGGKIVNEFDLSKVDDKKDIEVEKEWKNIESDAAKAHEITGIKVKATGNGTEKEVTLNKDNNWKGTIANLPKYDKDGKEIVYTISEEGLTDTDKANLAKYYKDPVINGGKIVNEFDLSKIDDKKDIEVEKEWKNIENDAAKAHEITGIKVKATGNGTEKEVTLNKDNNWKGTIANLPKYDKDGKEIVYTISEEGLTDTDKANLAKYYKDPVINGGKIVNEFDLSKVDDKKDIPVTKIWDDNNNQDGKRPASITIIANKEVGTIKTQVATQEINATSADEQGNWTHTFILPRYDANGAEITYSVDEKNINGNYTKSIDGTTITNTHEPEKYNGDGNLKVTKTWDDLNNKENTRPTSINVILNKTITEDDGTTTTSEAKRQSISADTNWTYTFTELQKYEDGKEITYSVAEEEVAGYHVTINQITSNKKEITITNKHDVKDMNVTKTATKLNGETISGEVAVKVGDVITYTITVENTGNVTLQNVEVTDNLIPETEFKQQIDTLEVGTTNKQSITVDYTVKAEDIESGKLTNIATAKAGDTIKTGTKELPISNVAIEKGIAERNVDANNNVTYTELSQDAIANAVYEVGDTVWYSIKVTNNGTVQDKVNVTDTLPAGLSYANQASEVNVRYDTTTRTITWNNVVLGAGQTKTLYVKTTITNAAITGTPVSSQTTGINWWKTNNDNKTVDKQTKTAKLAIRIDGEIIEGDVGQQNKNKYIGNVGTVNLKNKNKIGDNVDTTLQNAITVGTETTPTTMEEYSLLNYKIFNYIVDGTDLDTIATNINNSGKGITFNKDTQMLVCYTLKYDESDGYHIDAVIRDKTTVKVDLYNVTNKATVNGNDSNEVTIKVSNTTELTSIEAEKNWENVESIPESVDVRVYDVNGKAYDEIKSLSESNNWKATWDNLEKYDSVGNLINYSVKEVVVDYENETVTAFNNKDINGDYEVTYAVEGNKTTITNTFRKPEIAVTKSRYDEQNNKLDDGTNVMTNITSESTIIYKIEATNSGNAQGKVTVSDSIPENTELVGNVTVTYSNVENQTVTNKNPENLTITDGKFEKELTLDEGEKATITFTVKVTSYAGTQVTNTAEYKKPGEEKTTTTETVTTPVEAKVDVIPTTTTTTSNAQKVILVLDTSGSMGYGLDGSQWSNPKRIKVLKEAVEGFLHTFLPDGTSNQVMIIEYAENAKMICDYTSSATKAMKQVNSLDADGGTNTDGALELANSKITTDAANTSVILMTDGLPTFYVKDDGTLGGNGYDDWTNDREECREQAKASAQLIKNKGSKVYTIGFGLGRNSTAKTFLESVATKPSNYYPSDNSAALNDAFTQIAESIVSDGNKETLTTGGMNGTEKVESGKVVIGNEYFTEGQNVEIYTKPYTGANKEDNIPTTYTWNEFINNGYVTYENGKINFDIGKYMETNKIPATTKLTIRFVTPVNTRMYSLNVFSLVSDLCNDEEINDKTVVELEDKFSKAEQEKATTTPTAPAKTDKKPTENINTENNNVVNNTTDNTVKENTNSTVENTGANSVNTTTKPEDTTSKTEQNPQEIQKNNSSDDNTVKEIDAE